jgi:diguanylate cyclase (GGDEF)-like protein
MLSIIPIIIGAWYYGTRMGVLLSMGLYAICFLIVVLAGWGHADLIDHLGGLFGLLIASVTSIIVGRVGAINRHYKEEIRRQVSLLDERRSHARFLTMLNDILHAAMLTDNMSSMLKVLAEHTGRLFDTDKCYITLWDEKRRKTTRLAASGLLKEVYTSIYRSVPNERTLTAAILDSGHALPIEDVKVTPFIAPSVAEKFSHRSMLGLPLMFGSRKLGAIILGFNEHRHFTKDELERGELASRQIALVMAKLILLEESRQSNRELAGLQDISEAFSLHGDSHQTFGLLTETLAGLLRARVCMIVLFDAAAQELRAQIPAFGLDDDMLATFPSPAEGNGRLPGLSKKGTLLAKSKEEIPEEFRAWAVSCGIESLMVAPLRDDEKVLLGAIFTANKPGGFEEYDVHLAETFSSQVVTVIQNTQLLGTERKRVEQLSALHAIVLASTEAGNEDQLIERVTHLIGERLYPDSFGVLLLDETVGELSLHSSYRMGAHEGPMRVPLGIGIAGTVARSGKSRRVGDVASAPEHLSLYPLTRSQLCVPLKVEDELLGVVNAESTKIHAFTQEDEELLTIIAGQLAIAIQRLRVARAEHHQTEQLESSNSMIQALAQVNARAAAATDPDGVMQTLGTELARLELNCLIALADASFRQAIIRYISLPPRAVRAMQRVFGGDIIHDYVIPVERLAPYSDPHARASLLQDPAAVILNLLPDFPRRSANKVLKVIGVTEKTSICHLPLIAESKPVGILWMWGENLQESDLPTMSLFARQVAAVLQNAGLLAEVRRLAVTDDLTGLFNRRHFFELAQKEFAKAQRGKDPLSAMIVDLDRFKHFNDDYGHAIGDQILRNVAQLLQLALRESDILGRYGGEEFSILLPDTEAKTAVAVAERLVSQVSGASIETEAGPLSVQLSIGVAGMVEETPSLHLLINRADQAMYIAKAAGHNCVVVK